MKVSWESVPPAAAQTLRLMRLRQRQFAGPLHAHDAIELTWIEAGRGLRFVGGSVEPFEAGDMLLLAPRVAHTWKTSGAQGGAVRATVLQLHPRSELALLPEWQAAVGALLQTRAGAWAIEPPLREVVARRLARMPADEPLQLLGESLAVLALLARAALERTAAARAIRPMATGSRPGRPPDGARPQRIDAVLAWIHRQLHAELTADEGARLLHVTPAAFSRAFRRRVGKPFSVYVNDVRIAQACLRLAQTDRPVAEIAQQCGFATLSNFNRHFRERAGCTPREYRLASAAGAAAD